MADPPVQPDPQQAVEARLCAYLEGDLSAAEVADLERHLAEHPVHQRLLSDLSAQRGWLRALPRERAPAEVGDAYQQQAERSMLMGEDRPPVRFARRWPMIGMIAAMVVVAVGLAAVLALMLSGPANRPPGEQVAIAPPSATPPATVAAGPVATSSPTLADSAVRPPATPAAPAVVGRSRSGGKDAAAAPGNLDDEPAANRRRFAEANAPLGEAQQNQVMAQNIAPGVAEPDVRTVRLTVTTADATAVDVAVRRAVGRPVERAQAMSKALVSPTSSRQAARAGGGGAAFDAARSSVTAGDRQYVAAGLTPDQAVRLSADLKAAAGPGGDVVPAARTTLLARGQTVTVLIPQLAGTPGLTAANVVLVSTTDGTIRLPMIDPLPAAGETADALADHVATAYRRAELIASPTVTVVAGLAVDFTPTLPSTRPEMPGSTTVVIDVRPIPRAR